MERLVIYGKGGHGREMELAANSDPRETVLMDDASADLKDCDKVCVAVGSPQARRMLAERLAAFSAAKVIAPTAVVDPSAAIGEGVQISDFVFIGPNVTLGRHVQCNVRTHVHHDCVIGDFVTLSPGAMCLGNVHIEDDVFIGAGAIIRNGTPDKPLRIGKGAVVGMGAVVVKDVPPGVTVVGNPAGSPLGHGL